MYPGMMPQPSNSPFLDATANYSAMYPMNPPSATMPFGNSPMGMMAGMGMNSMFNQFGMSASQFMPTQSLQDQMNSRYYEMQTQQMLQQASQQDIGSQVRMAQGISQRMGYGWGAEQEATARQIARDFSAVSPLIAQMAPATYDALHGSRGSAVVMASSLARTAPFMIDPVTGATGLSAASSSALYGQIDSGLYGSADSMRSMYGMGMGEAGMMYNQIANRGLMGRSIGTYGKGEQQEMLARRMMSTGGASSMEEAISGIQSLTSDEFDTKLRQFDATRVSDRMKNLAGAVAAMKDIFGSMGQPDAPMAQIISGLDALTQGGLSSLSGPQVEKIVRNTKALSDRTGMSIDAITAMTSQAASITDAYGLDRTLAVQAGHHSAAYGAAYSNMGMNGQFGSMGRDQATMMDARLSAQALGSETVNKAGAFMRTLEAFSPTANSPAAKLAEAIRNGDTTFQGQKMTDIMTNENLGRILGASGVSGAGQQSFVNSLTDPFGNQKYISDNDLGNFGRAQQSAEVLRTIGSPAAAQGIAGALKSSGVGATKAASVADALSGKLANEFMNSELDPNDAKNRLAIASKIEADLRAQGIEPTRDMMQLIGENVYSRWNTMSKYRGGQGDLVKDRQMFSTRVMEETALVQANAAGDADFGKRLNTLGRTGPLRRAIDMLMKDGDMSVTDAVGEVLGGIPKEKINAVLEGQVGELAGLSKKLSSMKGEGPRGMFSERQLAERGELLRRFDALMGGTDDVPGIRAAMEAAGVDVGRQVTSGDFAGLGAVGSQLRGDIATPGKGNIKKGADLFMARAGNLTSALLGDDATINKMGEAGAKAFTKAQNGKLALDEIAKRAGGLDKVLSNKDHPDYEAAVRLIGDVESSLKAVGADIDDTATSGGSKTMQDWKSYTGKSAEEMAESAVSGLGKVMDLSSADRTKLQGMLSGDRDLASLVERSAAQFGQSQKVAEEVTGLKGADAMRKYRTMVKNGEVKGELNYSSGALSATAYEDSGRLDMDGVTSWIEKLKKSDASDRTRTESSSGSGKMVITGTIDLRNGEFEGHGTDF
jgi:hypothetical protein